jgi:hypothetical protein
VSTRLRPRLTVAAVLVGAIVVGGTAGVIVSMAGRGVAVSSPLPTHTPTPAATAVATPSPTLASTTPEPSAPPSPTSTPWPTPSIGPGDIGLPDGCFSEGLLHEGEPADELIVAEDLQRRLPLPGLWSEATALVGSSANSLFVSAFAECTGADPAEIRWGTVNVGLLEATAPQAVQVDGYSGPELAQILVDGYLHPQQRAALETGQHAGWTYRYLDKTIAITASADTVYWYWVWPCCYEGPLFVERTFVDVIHEYLDLTYDDPVPWP